MLRIFGKLRGVDTAKVQLDEVKPELVPATLLAWSQKGYTSLSTSP